MKGRVAFWFRIRRQGDQIVCEALFKLFGQQCNFCNQRDSSSKVIVWWILFIGNFSLIFLLPLFLQFLTPLWYPDQIENAVGFFASQVIVSYYGSGRNSLDRFIPNESVRRSQPRQSSPLVHHDSTRCQACKDGWCVASGVFA